MIAKEMVTLGEDEYFRFEVCFDVYLVFKYSNRWGHTEDGVELDKWIKENALGDYSIPANFVLFENHDDALLCYLRFKG